MDQKVGMLEKEVSSQISKLVTKGRIPSSDIIREEAGEYAVFPIYFTMATCHDGKPRKVGFRTAKHPIEAMVRDDSWNLSWRNTPETNVILGFHDNPEDNGKTFAGTYALMKWIGDVHSNGFDGMHGEGYDIAAQYMTDWNTLILKHVRTNGPKVSKKSAENITFSDIRSDVRKVKDDFVHNYKKHQNVALSDMLRRVSLFGEYLKSQDLPRGDKRYIRDMIDELEVSLRKRIKSKANGKEFMGFVDEIVENLYNVLNEKSLTRIMRRDINVEMPITFFDDEGSPTFHAALKAGYIDYVTKAVFFDDEAYKGKVLFSSWDLAGAKCDDRGDNVRIAPWINMVKCGREYMKTAIVSKIINDKLAPYADSDDPAVDTLRDQHAFLNSQILYRVLADNYQIQVEADTGFDQARMWLPQHFNYSFKVFGEDFMNQFRKNLGNNPANTIAIRKEQAEPLIPIYDRLLARYEMQAKAK